MVRGEVKKGLEKAFIFAGKAVLTLYNAETQNHFTYRVRLNKRIPDYAFIYVLSGPDNNAHYTYMGYVKDDRLSTSKKARVSVDS